jgi:hypothetical protein
MPLPFRVGFLDKDNRESEVAIKTPEKKSGYVPTTEYCPTRIVIKCFECRKVGIAEFVNGFNFADGDRLMAGKPIRGICYNCKKETEFVPLTKLTPEKTGEIRHLYDIQRSMDEMARLGIPIDANGTIVPFGRLRAYEEWRAKNGG